MNKLEPSTRLAIQAVVAVSLATLLAPLFHWERSYWSVLTAMLMISQTLGDSIKKSIERVSMTIIGGIVGRLLFFLTLHFPDLQKILLFISLFFCIFFLTSFYLWSVFFVSMLVVFLFASIQSWTVDLLTWRIIETLFGASMAILASAFIFPIKTNEKLSQELASFIEHLSSLTIMGIDCLIQKRVDPALLGQQQRSLLNELNILQQRLVTMRFELVFHPLQRRHLRHQLRSLIQWYDLLTSWLENLKHEPFTIHLYHRHYVLLRMKTMFINNIACIDDKQKIPVDLSPIVAFIRKLCKFSLKQKRIHFADAYRIYNHVHILREINALLPQLHKHQ